MSFQLEWAYWPLKFKFAAGTSRGILQEKDSYVIRLTHPAYPQRMGLGEISVLPGLSPECLDPNWIQTQFLAWEVVKNQWMDPWTAPNVNHLPSSLAFALECAWAQWCRSGSMAIFSDQPGFSPMKINGLIWMGDPTWMEKQIEEKLAAGFSTLKMKVGALDLSTEKRLLQKIRTVASSSELTLRVDANGAFPADQALFILDQLAEFDIHSIEQPIATGQWDNMAKLAENSPIPIALDEEMIGIREQSEKIKLLDHIHPPFIILKPSLHGGISSTRSWIELAEERKMQWWMTSALESNLGLHAICQFTSTFRPILPQGLGTGSLYHNNFPCPLLVKKGEIRYEENGPQWNLEGLSFHSQPVNPLS